MEQPALDARALTVPATPGRAAPAPRAPARLLAWSNLLTYGAVAAGLAAAWAALVRRDAAAAGACLATAVLCDTFDGAFARRFDRTPFEREFGGQIDSLADAVVSGAVPPLALLALTADPGQLLPAVLLPAAALAWVIAAITRLAYYNLAAGDGGSFVGLPTPVAALVAATALLWPIAWMATATVLLGGAVAMVAPLRIPRPRGLGLAAFAAWAAAVVGLHLSAALG